MSLQRHFWQLDASCSRNAQTLISDVQQNSDYQRLQLRAFNRNRIIKFTLMDLSGHIRNHLCVLCYFIALQILPAAIQAQNLIPNPGFELHANHMDLAPPLATEFLLQWYSCTRLDADPYSEGTPDYYDDAYPYPSTNGTSFWNIVLGAAEGEHYVGLGNHVLYAGYYTPEALSIKLDKKLESGKIYHLGMSVRNKGVGTYDGKAPEFCETKADRRIEVLLSSDSIFLDIDALNNLSWHNAQRTIDIRSPRLTATEAGYWANLGTCIESDGTENFIAITMPSGTFDVDAPCIIQPDHWDAFYTYYYDLDDLQLFELPEYYELLVENCEENPGEINIASLLAIPPMQNNVQIIWPDDHQDSTGIIEEEGQYELSLVLDCTTIPIYLTVKHRQCGADLYVANTFTPNGDLTNDKLEVNISADLPIQEFTFEIYDRWGSSVYRSANWNESWDGKYKGRDVVSGIYTWIIKFNLLDEDGITEEMQKSGTVKLVR
ncbi:gliding motility-associated C-terminal domain-containing protein [Saprospiraceae bacterium]|nr:gliding motility-associated C-terminal domain-containing protein [Saprospiraceae bacterium]